MSESGELPGTEGVDVTPAAELTVLSGHAYPRHTVLNVPKPCLPVKQPPYAGCRTA